MGAKKFGMSLETGEINLKSFFCGDFSFRAPNPTKFMKNNTQGIVFVKNCVSEGKAGNSLSIRQEENGAQTQIVLGRISSAGILPGYPRGA